MNATRTYSPSRKRGGPGAANPSTYLGWSHRNARMEMMDLPTYIDSFRQSYETLREAYGSLLGGGSSPDQWYSAARPQGQHEHRHGHDCGCAPEPDCRCECCIQDADIVVYAHCGEVRVVPIEVENDTRRVREGITVDVTEIRTSGGRTLPWQTLVTPDGPLTLEPCSTTKLELLVHISCDEGQDESKDGAGSPRVSAQKKRAGDAKEQSSTPSEVASRSFVSGRTSGDLAECVVGYLSIRLGGCLTRPIVVAIAALPDSCDSYRTGCSCSCCC